MELHTHTHTHAHFRVSEMVGPKIVICNDMRVPMSEKRVVRYAGSRIELGVLDMRFGKIVQ